jgi:tetratricopeptide (TPR) repeat protein
LWYELIAPASDLSPDMKVPKWLLNIAKDELEFREAVGLLSRYSLTDAKEDTNSHSMHPVLHKWCYQLSEGDKKRNLCCLAVGLVASNVSSKSDSKFWNARKRILAHGIRVGIWIIEDFSRDAIEFVEAPIQPWMFHNLGYLLSDESKLEAEKMYERALKGYEKVFGPEHTSTLITVNNLGSLYTTLGKLDEAEKMYERALKGYEKAFGPEHTSTLNTVNNLGNLYKTQGKLDEAEKMYERALKGYTNSW